MFQYKPEEYKSMSVRADEGYYNGKDQLFRQDAEHVFDIEQLPKPIRDKIHALAWEHGHSSGYREVLNCYHEYVELVDICYRENENAIKAYNEAMRRVEMMKGEDHG